MNFVLCRLFVGRKGEKMVTSEAHKKPKIEMEEDRNISDREFQEMKDRMRQEAYQKELHRQTQIKERQGKVIRWLTIGIVVEAFAILLILSSRSFNHVPRHGSEDVSKISDTIYMPSDTVFVPTSLMTMEGTFYTAQVGAFKRNEIPEELKKGNFPMFQYTYNGLTCIAFGHFEKLHEAEAALLFLKKLGFSRTIIVKIKDGERIETVL
jgi:hypothetical protein